ELGTSRSHRAPEPTLQLSPAPSPASSCEVVDVPTRTNPIGFDPSIGFAPDVPSLGDPRLRVEWWRSRAAMTICLGALIGIPPAVMDIWWWARRRAAWHAGQTLRPTNAEAKRSGLATPLAASTAWPLPAH